MSDTLIVGEALGVLASEGVRKDGTATFRARIIEGNVQGSSGYYSRELLERDGPEVFAAKTQMHLDHQSFEQFWEFPAGSLKDMAGFISSTPEYLDAGVAGESEPEGLYADVTVVTEWAQFIYDLREVIGISIKAPALTETWINPETNEETELVTKLFGGPMTTVDFVTHPGANGRLLALVESEKYELPAGAKLISHRTSATEAVGVPKKEKTQMDEDQKKALEALSAQLALVLPLLTAEAAARDAKAEADKKALEESEKVDVDKVIGESVALLAAAKLPEAAATRVLEVVKGGSADLPTAIAAEQAYIKSLTGGKTKATESEVTPFSVVSDDDGASTLNESALVSKWTGRPVRVGA